MNETADNDEIKKAYRKLCKILHPDVHSNTPEANTMFRLLHEAYETLSDPKKRNNYQPIDHSNSLDNITVSAYDEMIRRYQIIIGDYEELIKSKTRREKDLLNQISQLKNAAENREKNHKKASIELPITQKSSSKGTANKAENDNVDIILWFIAALLILTLIILFVAYPFWMTTLGLLMLFLGSMYRTFK